MLLLKYYTKEQLFSLKYNILVKSVIKNHDS